MERVRVRPLSRRESKETLGPGEVPRLTGAESLANAAEAAAARPERDACECEVPSIGTPVVPRAEGNALSVKSVQCAKRSSRI